MNTIELLLNIDEDIKNETYQEIELDDIKINNKGV